MVTFTYTSCRWPLSCSVNKTRVCVCVWLQRPCKKIIFKWTNETKTGGTMKWWHIGPFNPPTHTLTRHVHTHKQPLHGASECPLACTNVQRGRALRWEQKHTQAHNPVIAQLFSKLWNIQASVWKEQSNCAVLCWIHHTWDGWMEHSDAP